MNPSSLVACHVLVWVILVLLFNFRHKEPPFRKHIVLGRRPAVKISQLQEGLPGETHTFDRRLIYKPATSVPGGFVD
jgi:hypothetical protein